MCYVLEILFYVSLTVFQYELTIFRVRTFGSFGVLDRLIMRT